MDKRNWYTGQVVQESHMDTAFDNVETAIQRTYSDAGIRGITSGLGVTAGAGTKEVVLGTGVAYDIYGRRIPVSAVQTIDLTVDSTSAPITNPSGANVRWVSVFVKFEISETGLAVDGGGNEILTQTSDSFSIVVKQAAEGPLISATRPTADSDEVKCADIKLELGTGVIPPGNIELTYADLAFEATRLDSSVVGGKTLDAALTAIYQDVEALVQGVTDGVDTLSGEVDAIDIRLTAVEGDIVDPTALPSVGTLFPYPHADGSGGFSQVTALTLAGFMELLDTIPVLYKKGTDGDGTTSDEDRTFPTLTSTEVACYTPLIELDSGKASSKPGSLTKPCLLFKFPLGPTIRLRFYAQLHGLIITYNCHVRDVTTTTLWTADSTATPAWAFTLGSLANSGAYGIYHYYKNPTTTDWAYSAVGGANEWDLRNTVSPDLL